jgi:hypothetical protein
MCTIFLRDLDKEEFRKPYLGQKTNFSGNKKIAGVYFIKENGVIVYIGMSAKCLYDTLYRHFQKWTDNRNGYMIQYSNPPYPRVTYQPFLQEHDYEIFYFPCIGGKEAHELEKAYIRHYQPRDNKEKYQIFFKKEIENSYEKAENIIPREDTNFTPESSKVNF